jgi:DNA ligase-4
MFQAMAQDRTASKKRSRLRTFIEVVYGEDGRDDYFSALRLLLPGLDRERSSYGLKEATLATALVDALGIAKDSPDAVRLTNWRRAGGGRNAGNFALVAAEVSSDKPLICLPFSIGSLGNRCIPSLLIDWIAVWGSMGCAS